MLSSLLDGPLDRLWLQHSHIVQRPEKLVGVHAHACCRSSSSSNRHSSTNSRASSDRSSSRTGVSRLKTADGVAVVLMYFIRHMPPSVTGHRCAPRCSDVQSRRLCQPVRIGAHPCSQAHILSNHMPMLLCRIQRKCSHQHDTGQSCVMLLHTCHPVVGAVIADEVRVIGHLQHQHPRSSSSSTKAAVAMHAAGA